MPEPPTEYRYPCENCGASLRFTPGQRVLTCDWCGHTQNIGPGASRAPGRRRQGTVADDAAVPESPATGGALQWDAGHKSPGLIEIPLAEGLRLDDGSQIATTIATVTCPNCGARFEAGPDRHATACPFCATPVVTDTGQTRQIKPQGVLPFVITEQQARGALEAWMKGLWFAPSGLRQYSRRNRRMSGVYSPFWTFDADTRTAYSGRRGDYYYETVWVTQVVNGRSQRVATQVRRTRWRSASGQVARDFDDVLVLASTSLPRRFTDALTPWDLSHLVEFRPEYLAGFEAEGYTVPLSDGHAAAREEMANVIAMDIRRDIGGDEQQITTTNTDHSSETFKHVLLPIWSAAYKYGGKSYRFVVNGQSGRVQGERPWSPWKIAAAVVLALILVAAALLLAEQGQWLQTGIGPSGGFSIPDLGGTVIPGGDDGGFVIRGY